jgi:hypothetical protein
MRDARLFGISPLTLATLALLLPFPLVGSAQDVTESALKAAYVYNFARFTEWPDLAPASQPLAICVVGDASVGEALERLVKGRLLAGRAIVVSRVTASGPKVACHVLYVSGVTAPELSQAVAAVQDARVLTIGDAVNFTQAGGIAQLFFERGQLHFNINRQAVKRARLQIHSRLLALAQRYE